MKLRFQFNSIRLRLKRSEVEQLVKTGRVEEKIVLGVGAQDIFRYVLESSGSATTLVPEMTDGELKVVVPLEMAMHWAKGSDVGMEGYLPAGDQPLQILIEKDFACLDRSDVENADTFPHPLAGTKC